MKKNAIRILSLFLVVMTLVGVISLPVSAYSYPMNYTITYKTSDGKVLDTKSGTVDAAAETRNALRITSPSFDGYVLKNDSDAVVTGSRKSLQNGRPLCVRRIAQNRNGRQNGLRKARFKLHHLLSDDQRIYAV